MSAAIRITAIVENTAAGAGLAGEHGLALWIETPAGRVLFDTGQGPALLPNARQLGVDLASADAVVISHGHYDHIGGLREVLKIAPRAKVYAHPAAFVSRYGRNRNGSGRQLGIPDLDEEQIRELSGGLVWTEGPTEIVEGLFVTGQVPRLSDFEDTGGPFFADEACGRPDLLLDDQAMFFRAVGGLVVLLGCSHSGVINTLRYVCKIAAGGSIEAVIGGMHLINASPQRMERTVEQLRRMEPGRLYPAHCTGPAAVEALIAAFRDRCDTCNVGTRLEFPLP